MLKQPLTIRSLPLLILQDRVIAWASAGKVNFSGSRKSSAFAATVAAQDAGKIAAAALGMKEVEVNLKGLELDVSLLFEDCKVQV